MIKIEKTTINFGNWAIRKCCKNKWYLGYDFKGTRSTWIVIAELRSYKKAKEVMLNIDTIIMKLAGMSTL